MTQISIVSAQTKTIQATIAITAMTGVNALIQVTTGSAHGLVTGDIVQISGVVSPAAAANGQWVVTLVSPTVFSLNNSLGSGTWGSGGSVVHVGFATAATLVDNTVFAAVPANLTLVYRAEVIPASAKVRFVFEDSADSAFVTAMAGPAGSFQGQITKVFDKRFDSRYQDFPDLRLGSSGDNMRVKTLFGSPTPGNTYQWSAWLEY